MRTFLHRYDVILRMKILSLILITLNIFSVSAFAETATSATTEIKTEPQVVNKEALSSWCTEILGRYKNYKTKTNLVKACERVLQKDGCASVNGKPIFHLDQKGKNEKGVGLYSKN